MSTSTTKHHEDDRSAGDLAERPDLVDTFGTRAEESGKAKGPGQELAQAIRALSFGADND